MAEQLSPEALTVWDAFCNIVEDHGPPRLALAAAIRAVARKIVPPIDDPEWFSPGNCCERVVKQERDEIRLLLQDLAFELENRSPTK